MADAEPECSAPSETAEALFEGAWVAGLLDPLPWGVLADRLRDEERDDTARRAEVLRDFDPGLVNWGGSQNYEGYDGADWRAGWLAALLFQELIAERYPREGSNVPAVVAAHRIGARLALGLPVGEADRSAAASAARTVAQDATRAADESTAQAAALLAGDPALEPAGNSGAWYAVYLLSESAASSTTECQAGQMAGAASSSAARSVLEQVERLLAR